MVPLGKRYLVVWKNPVDSNFVPESLLNSCRYSCMVIINEKVINFKYEQIVSTKFVSKLTTVGAALAATTTGEMTYTYRISITMVDGSLENNFSVCVLNRARKRLKVPRWRENCFGFELKSHRRPN